MILNLYWHEAAGRDVSPNLGNSNTASNSRWDLPGRLSALYTGRLTPLWFSAVTSTKYTTPGSETHGSYQAPFQNSKNDSLIRCLPDTSYNQISIFEFSDKSNYRFLSLFLIKILTFLPCNWNIPDQRTHLFITKYMAYGINLDLWAVSKRLEAF